MKKLSNRVYKVKPSFTLQMATIAADMKSKGMDVINFSVGEPDFNTPLKIIEAGKKAMDDGFTKYTAGPGMIELREAICEKLKQLIPRQLFKIAIQAERIARKKKKHLF